MTTSRRKEVEEAREAASDWLRGHAAFASRACAVAPRRGLGEAEARWVPGPASQTWAGTRCSWPGHLVLCGKGNWRSQKPLCRAGRSPPRRPPPPLLPGASCPSGCVSAQSQRQVMMSRAPVLAAYGEVNTG